MDNQIESSSSPQPAEPDSKGLIKNESLALDAEVSENVIRPAYLKIAGFFLIVGTIITGIAILVHYNLIAKAAEWIDKADLGFYGWLAYISLCVICSVLLLPQTPIEAAAGVIWSHSFWKAFVAAYVGKQIGSWVRSYWLLVLVIVSI